MKEVTLSVGYLNYVSHLLRIIHDNPGSNLEVIEKIVSNDDIIIRKVSSKIFLMSLDIGWIIIAEDNSVSLNHKIPEDIVKDSIKLQRELLWIYVETKRPPWAKHLHKGVKTLRLRITGSDEKQVFQDLGLFVEPDNTTPGIIQWWARAAIFSRSISNQELLETGNEGELLSLKFEKDRTGINPIHAAYYSHSYGYDIKSQKDRIDSTPLYIEVKSSTQKYENAKFYLTRSEYETCKKKGRKYIFHLWDLSFEIKKMIIINGDQVLKRAPIDQEGGIWTNYSVDFSQFNWTDAYETTYQVS
ncbi:DUF3883 domain-containing protein [Euryarchaeota archaeon]|nr:DUF3883 domain-containing protein [Euryarchaeota archaeon]|tara:strand:- start:467 stop:1369 length:903 start_codon:yes stop_codon:yes gene_type:complete